MTARVERPVPAAAPRDLLASPAPPALDRATAIAAAIVGGAGLGSSILLGWALENLLVAAVYGAVVLTAAGFGLAFSMRSRVEAAADESDWPLIRGVLDGTGEAMALTALDGTLISANRNWAAMTGSYEEPVALGVTDTVKTRLDEARDQVQRDGKVELRARLRLAAGPADAAVTVRRVGSDAPYLLWSLERAGADALMDETIRRFEAHDGRWLGRAGVLAALVDATGRIISANRSFRTLALGSPEAEAAGEDFSRFLEMEDGAIRLLPADGEARPMRLIKLELDSEEGGGQAGYLFLLIDPEDESDGDTGPSGAAPAAGSVESLLGMLPLGLALADRDGRFRFLNDAFLRAAGASEGPEPLYPSDLVIEDDKAMAADIIRAIAVGRQPPRDLRVRLKSRPEEPVALTVAHARGLGVSSLVLYLKDNSEQEKLERQVAQATKMQAVGQLAGGVAHDFNNILTAVIGYCDLVLLRHAPGDSDFDDISQIKHNANRAANLVRQLLAFSRQQTLRMQVLQISDVVAELSHMLKRLLGEQVRLTVKHGRNLGPVRVDPGQLEQVIVNLAVNARDAMDDGGELLISTYGVSAADARRMGSDILPAADYTVLRVEDSGRGIPPDVLPKVFEPFFTTKEVGKGTGLGLSTVYGIVKQSGGYIFVDSEPGRGTAFTIYLPVHGDAAADPAEEAPAGVTALAEPDGADMWGAGSILLVEDEAMVRAVAERALIRKGYKVMTATNGEEALEILESGVDVDLLLSDVVMPTMDGPTLVGHARRRDPALPVVFMSGYAEEQLRRSIDVPDVAFLPKPFSVQQLADVVRAALLRARKLRDEVSST
jgi:two-component system cell cycle sensor histidine kinase/response regulator CckA